jgi:hypothetical protein
VPSATDGGLNVLNDYGKLIVLVIAMLGGFAMIVVGAVVHDSSLYTPGVGIVTMALGYVTGNGVLASQGKAPSPVIVPSDRKVRRRLAEVAIGELADEDARDAAAAEDAELLRVAREEGLLP